MLNNINFNLNLPNIVPTLRCTTSPLCTNSPTFRAELNEDRFEKSESVGKRDIEAKILKIMRAKKSKIKPTTLKKISAIFVDQTERATYAQNKQGKTAFTYSLREYLLRNLTTKNTFFLSLHQDAIRKFSQDIAIASGFGEITTDPLDHEKMLGEFRQFLGIIYDNEGQAAVDKILKPLIRREFKSKSAKKLYFLASDYYRRKEGKTLKMQTEVIESGVRADAYIDGKFVASHEADSTTHAIAQLSAKLLEEKGMMPNASDRKLNDDVTISHRCPVAAAMTILKNMHFLEEGEILDKDADDKLARELVAVVNTKERRANSFQFQRLEFLGDAIANNAASRVLLSKGLDDLTTKDLHAKLIENTTYANLAYTLRLIKTPATTATKHELKTAADVFEAVVAVLYKHYSPARVDRYLRILLEYEFNKIVSD